MLKSIFTALIFSLLALFIFGCSGGNGYPTMPLDIHDNPEKLGQWGC